MAALCDIPARLRALIEARDGSPFDVLGPRREGAREVIRAFLPHAEQAWIVEDAGRLPMRRVTGTGMFEWEASATAPAPARRYLLGWEDASGCYHEAPDPYAFAPSLPDFDLHLFGLGSHWHAYRLLGAHPAVRSGTGGVRFATWAPNASRVSVVGDFNRWDGRCHPMQARHDSGVWELFVPGVLPGARYKFEIRNRANAEVLLKTDPYGQAFEHRPANAAIVTGDATYAWRDADWMAARKTWSWLSEPVSIYEVHAGSWRRDENGAFLGYRELAAALVDYVADLGFTHIELMPVTEHALDESWGYQTTGYFAATSRFGSPSDLKYLIDECHRRGIGVIIDWAPAHFPRDAHALAAYDGAPLYEDADPRRAEHRDWGTLIFNFERNEVRNFLLSSAFFWLEEFHADGLRIDAVSSALYLNYSKADGEWLPNRYGGVENLDAIAFFRQLNSVLHAEHPGSMIIAEESTAFPGVSRPVHDGGLGFSMKWNMGWMHDTLRYLSRDPIHRRYHHHELTFGLLYAFSENYVLPLSHDEVVHGKRSLIGRMPGDAWQQFANLRLLYLLMFSNPGKKLLFMGGEFAQRREWNCLDQLDWDLLNEPLPSGTRNLVRDLNTLYRDSAALHAADFESSGFEWLDCHDAERSVIAFVRRGHGEHLVVVVNLTPEVRDGYRVGVPHGGSYREILNTDAPRYGGSDVGNPGVLDASRPGWVGREFALTLTLPPLAGVILAPAPAPAPGLRS